MNTLARVAFLVLCALLLAVGLSAERHAVRRLDNGQMQQLRGWQFIEGATVDQYLRQDGRLWDAYSLSPPSAQEKDCKT